jgi:hypothetical protein
MTENWRQQRNMCLMHVFSDDNDDSNSISAIRLAASLPVSDEMMSSTCSDSVALELTTSTSDGLSDKENVVRLLKNQMKFSSARLSVGVGASCS